MMVKFKGEYATHYRSLVCGAVLRQGDQPLVVSLGSGCGLRLASVMGSEPHASIAFLVFSTNTPASQKKWGNWRVEYSI